MRKIYRFRAKQNQCAMVCRILKEKVGKPHVEILDGIPVITVMLPNTISKRAIDNLLFEKGVPGAKARKNKLIVIKGDHTSVLYKDHPVVESGEPFIWVNDKGKFMGKFKRQYIDFGCECCGGYYDLVEIKKKKK